MAREFDSDGFRDQLDRIINTINEEPDQRMDEPGQMDQLRGFIEDLQTRADLIIISDDGASLWERIVAALATFTTMQVEPATERKVISDTVREYGEWVETMHGQKINGDGGRLGYLDKQLGDIAGTQMTLQNLHDVLSEGHRQIMQKMAYPGARSVVRNAAMARLRNTLDDVKTNEREIEEMMGVVDQQYRDVKTLRSMIADVGADPGSEQEMRRLERKISEREQLLVDMQMKTQLVDNAHAEYLRKVTTLKEEQKLNEKKIKKLESDITFYRKSAMHKYDMVQEARDKLGTAVFGEERMREWGANYIKMAKYIRDILKKDRDQYTEDQLRDMDTLLVLCKEIDITDQQLAEKRESLMRAKLKDMRDEDRARIANLEVALAAAEKTYNTNTKDLRDQNEAQKKRYEKVISDMAREIEFLLSAHDLTTEQMRRYRHRLAELSDLENYDEVQQQKLLLDIKRDLAPRPTTDNNAYIELENKYEQLQDTLKAAREKTARLRGDTSEMERTIKELTDTHNDDVTEKHAWGVEKNRLLKSLDAEREKVKRYEEQHEEILNELRDMNMKNEENKKTRQELKDARARLDRATKRVGRAEDRVSKFLSDLNDTKKLDNPIDVEEISKALLAKRARASR